MAQQAIKKENSKKILFRRNSSYSAEKENIEKEKAIIREMTSPWRKLKILCIK